MELFGLTIPLWAVFLGIIIIIIIAWKLIKFAIKILLILIVFLVILIGVDFGLDFFGVFTQIQSIVQVLL
jgi:hypothetical protein